MLPEAHSGFSLFPTLSSPASTSHWQTQLEEKQPQSPGKAISGHLSFFNAEKKDEKRVWEPIGPELAEVTAVLVFQVCLARLGCSTPCLKPHLGWELQKSGEGFDLQCDGFFFVFCFLINFKLPDLHRQLSPQPRVCEWWASSSTCQRLAHPLWSRHKGWGVTSPPLALSQCLQRKQTRGLRQARARYHPPQEDWFKWTGVLRGHLFYKCRKEKLWMRKYVAPGANVRDLATSLRWRSHPDEAGLKESQRKQVTTLMTASGWKTNHPHPHPRHLITLWETTNSLVL